MIFERDYADIGKSFLKYVKGIIVKQQYFNNSSPISTRRWGSLTGTRLLCVNLLTQIKNKINFIFVE